MRIAFRLLFADQSFTEDPNDVEIRELEAKIQTLEARIRRLESLVARLSTNSSNSSKPPPLDGTFPGLLGSKLEASTVWTKGAGHLSFQTILDDFRRIGSAPPVS